jgi:hypothetical protein
LWKTFPPRRPLAETKGLQGGSCIEILGQQRLAIFGGELLQQGFDGGGFALGADADLIISSLHGVVTIRDAMLPPCALELDDQGLLGQGLHVLDADVGPIDGEGGLDRLGVFVDLRVDVDMRNVVHVVGPLCVTVSGYIWFDANRGRM